MKKEEVGNIFMKSCVHCVTKLKIQWKVCLRITKITELFRWKVNDEAAIMELKCAYPLQIADVDATTKSWIIWSPNELSANWVYCKTSAVVFSSRLASHQSHAVNFWAQGGDLLLQILQTSRIPQNPWFYTEHFSTKISQNTALLFQHYCCTVKG